MAAHIFVVTEENFQVCVKRGIVGLPEVGSDDVFDILLSRLSGIKEGDYVLMYVTKSGNKSGFLYGVWQVKGRPFYDNSPVWQDRIYPFRCRIEWSEYNFKNGLELDDINYLRYISKIWTWALKRPNGITPNSMFSISNGEFQILLTEFMKINPFTTQKGVISDPYPDCDTDTNIIEKLHFQDGKDGKKPKFESTIMALLNAEFAKKSYTNIFGNYTDYLCYVPNTFGGEMDFLLLYESANHLGLSYDIIEVKNKRIKGEFISFDENDLSQLISYESCFQKVSGDSSIVRVRTTAIAPLYDDAVIQYVAKRKEIEHKPIRLLQYSYENGSLKLVDVS